MSLTVHIHTLEQRHAALDDRIAAEHGRPCPDGPAITRLKTEKLRLKEELERLRHGAGR